MKVFHVKKQLAALFMPGFLIGIIYVNFLAKKYVAAPDLFSEYFLDQFRGVQIDEKEYLWYLLRIRCVPFFMLSGLALTKLKKVSAGLFLGWTGISVGVQKMVKTKLLKYLVVQWFIMLKQVNISVISPNTDKK